jgi:hypothetical protein
MGAAPASRAKAFSDLIRPWCGQESRSWVAACGPTPAWASSCGASLREGLDLACELAFVGLQLQHALSDRAEGEQAPTQLGIASRVGSSGWQAVTLGIATFVAVAHSHLLAAVLFVSGIICSDRPRRTPRRTPRTLNAAGRVALC